MASDIPNSLASSLPEVAESQVQLGRRTAFEALCEGCEAELGDLKIQAINATLDALVQKCDNDDQRFRMLYAITANPKTPDLTMLLAWHYLILTSQADVAKKMGEFVGRYASTTLPDQDIRPRVGAVLSEDGEQ